MIKIAEFNDFEIYMDDKFKGSPSIKIHYIEDDIDGNIDLCSGDLEGDFDQYIKPTLIEWFQCFHERLLEMWSSRNITPLPSWE